MAYHLPALQPLWSFVTPANSPTVLSTARQEQPDVPVSAPAVLGWDHGPDGRLVPNWCVGQRRAPGLG